MVCWGGCWFRRTLLDEGHVKGHVQGAEVGVDVYSCPGCWGVGVGSGSGDEGHDMLYGVGRIGWRAGTGSHGVISGHALRYFLKSQSPHLGGAFHFDKPVAIAVAPSL